MFRRIGILSFFVLNFIACAHTLNNQKSAPASEAKITKVPSEEPKVSESKTNTPRRIARVPNDEAIQQKTTSRKKTLRNIPKDSI